MFTSGNPSFIRVSQKRLTVVLSIIALLGSLALSLAWWDSVSNFTGISTSKRTIAIDSSSVIYATQSLSSLGFDKFYVRENFTIYIYSDSRPLFPLPHASSDFISIPIYLVILTYLATLLLIWLVLMNRLARREFLEQGNDK